MVVGMAEQQPPTPDSETGGDMMNKIIVVILGLLLLGFSLPLTIRSGDAILASFAGSPFSVATLFLLAVGLGLMFLGAGLIWRVIRASLKSR
jgi:hypothetical protein